MIRIRRHYVQGETCLLSGFITETSRGRSVNMTISERFTTAFVPGNKEVDMLVLSRKKRESILIGDNIRVTVVACNDGTCRIGIEAPREINVVREELRKTPKEEPSE